MQKCRFLFILVSLCLCIQGVALYNGNPDLPEMPEEGFFIPNESLISVKFGYEGDVIFAQRMKVSSKNKHIHHRTHSFKSLYNAGMLTLGVADRVEVYALAGGLWTKVSYNPNHSDHLRLNTGTNFAGEVGMRTLLLYWGDTKLSVDAKYFFSFPGIDTIKINGHKVSSSGSYVNETDWQVGIGISHRFSWVIPYIGADYSSVLMKFKHLNSLKNIFPNKKFTLRNQMPYGIFAGFGFTADKGIALNFEARFLNEYALTAALDIRF